MASIIKDSSLEKLLVNGCLSSVKTLEEILTNFRDNPVTVLHLVILKKDRLLLCEVKYSCKGNGYSCSFMYSKELGKYLSDTEETQGFINENKGAMYNLLHRFSDVSGGIVYNLSSLNTVKWLQIKGTELKYFYINCTSSDSIKLEQKGLIKLGEEPKIEFFL